jgi:oligoribonuclease (3'-5' exoribonuclease)
MRYLSIDIESTGLNEDCHIIEFAMVPFDTETKTIESSMARNFLVKCPPFEELRPRLDQWVFDNMSPMIKKAAEHGKPLDEFKKIMSDYVQSEEVKNYFGNKKIVLFGKSMNAIDLPFLNRDLGWNWMRQHFHFRVLDLSSACFAMMDLGLLPPGHDSGSTLMQFLGMGDVAHTALEDATNTAQMYIRLIEMFENRS